jgi:hypothetical protein
MTNPRDINCDTQGHLWGPEDKCVMCKAPKPAQPSSKQRNLGPKQPPRIHGERCICGDNGTNPRCPVKDYKPPAKPSNQWDEDPMNNLIMPGSRYELSGYCAACKRKWNLTCQTGTEVLVKSFHCECGHVTEMEGRAAVEPSVDVKQMNRDLCAKDGHVLGVTARPCLRCHEWFDPIYGTEQMRKDTLENASPETAPEIVEWKNVDTGETGTLCTLCGHEQNPNQSPSADIEALLESFVWAVRRDNDNGDQYTRQEVKDLRAELLAAIRAVQPPRVGLNGAGEILGCKCSMCEFHRSAEDIERKRRALTKEAKL